MNIPAFKARKSDIVDILGLWRQLMNEARAVGDEVINIEEVIKGWAWRLGKQIEQGMAFVAKKNNRTVGFVCFIGKTEENNEIRQEPEKAGGKTSIPRGIAYITDMYVSPEARITNAAPNLLYLLTQEAKQAGFSAVWTNTAPDNKPMQAFLKKMGFSKLDDFILEKHKNHKYYEKLLQ